MVSGSHCHRQLGLQPRLSRPQCKGIATAQHCGKRKRAAVTFKKKKEWAAVPAASPTKAKK